MQNAGVEVTQLVTVKTGCGAAIGRIIKSVQNGVQGLHGHDGQRGPQARQQRRDGDGLKPFVPQAGDAQAAQTFGKLAPLGIHQQGNVPIGGMGVTYGLAQLNLGRGVHHVIFPANHMTDPKINVIHHRGQRIHRHPVGPKQHGIGQVLPLEMHSAAAFVLPRDGGMV